MFLGISIVQADRVLWPFSLLHLTDNDIFYKVKVRPPPPAAKRLRLAEDSSDG